MLDTTKPFSISLWGSNPELDNDDCWMSDDFATHEEAMAVRAQLLAGQIPEGWLTSHKDPLARAASFWETLRSTEFITIDGPGLLVNQMKPVRNPHFKPSRQRDYGRSEAQMQAAMEFGAQGWNDYEGY